MEISWDEMNSWTARCSAVRAGQRGHDDVALSDGVTVHVIREQAMKRFGRLIFLAMMLVGLTMPGMAGSAAAVAGSDHICDRALSAGAGAVVDGLTVVWYTGGSGHQIVLGDGGSVLDGGSGHDVLCAWGGGNTLVGGSGNDSLFIMSGMGNALYGGSGNDTMIGNEGDTFDRGSGKDYIEVIPDPRTLVATMVKASQSPFCIAELVLTGFAPNTTYNVLSYDANGPRFSPVPVTTDASGSAVMGPWSIRQGNHTFYFSVDGVFSNEVTFLCGW
jgi:hypothetical protein